MDFSNLLYCLFYFSNWILYSECLYSIILTNILDIFGHECLKVMIDYENHCVKFYFQHKRLTQSQIEIIISIKYLFVDIQFLLRIYL